MRSIPGHALITDFDGTIALLPVAWASLRQELGVNRIPDLWDRDSVDAWAAVTLAEVEAAAIAQPISIVIDHLLGNPWFAILTNNSEQAVITFLDRFDELKARTIRVVGRESLQGSKADFSVFTQGYQTCRAALRLAHDHAPVIYLGNQADELEFARRLGARPLHVAELTGL